MSEKEASGGSPQAGAVTVSDVQELIKRKEEIEAQIKANYDVLESVSMGWGGGCPRRCWGHRKGCELGTPDPGGLGGLGGRGGLH